MRSSISEDNQLREASTRGDVSFLRNCVTTNKPMKFFLTLFPKIHSQTSQHGNIFHLSISNNKVEFIQEALLLLQPIIVKQLLLQQRSEDKWNPLHLAASMGNVEIIKMFLIAFSSSPSSSTSNEKPWIQKTSYGQTPCHLALIEGSEVCALELLKMDMELQCKMVDNEGNSLLFAAIMKGFHEFALKILKSNCSFSCSGINGFTPLHYVTRCSEGEEICRLLLERERDLIYRKSKNGYSILHEWAKEGKLWPFECLLKSVDIIRSVTKFCAEFLTVTDNDEESNPLHVLAKHATNEKLAIQIAQLLIDAYKLEEMDNNGNNISKSISYELPWLREDKKGRTILSIAIERNYENLGMFVLLMDNHLLMKGKHNALLLAINKGCREVSELCLEIVNKRGWNQLLSNDQKINALHLAPLCRSKGFIKRLLESCPELAKGIAIDGSTILHNWAKIGELWPFEYLFKTKQIDNHLKTQFAKQICTCDYNDQNTPLHISLLNSKNEASHQIVKFLVQVHKSEIRNWIFVRPVCRLPWFLKNKNSDGILHLALRNKHENFAFYVLSLYEHNIKELLEYYEPIHKTIFLAIQKNCNNVAKEIMSRFMSKENWTTYFRDSYNGRNILHLVANYCTDEDFGRWLVKEVSECVNEADKSGKTPLDEACEVGAAWYVKAILENDSRALDSAPFAWVKACKRGHLSVIRVFIDYYPGKFNDHCIQHQDSPLHHIQLRNITAYEQFLKLPGMKDLINLQNAQGATPLHMAIRNGNILLAEILLNMDKIRYNIKDHENKTARDLLEQVCKSKERPEWDLMCKSIGFDPRIKTSYFQHKTNLLDVRNTLSVVAALLATITFTAGFTLPGGFNQNGEAVLADKAAFLVFLISDALAMCFSMLVLICLIWSMVYDSNKSLFLIDRSMMLLMLALYCTLLAFMTGVYIVIAPKSLWAAILIIFMCSLLGISSNRTILYKVLDNIIPSANKDSSDRVRLLELGKGCNSSCLKSN